MRYAKIHADELKTYHRATSNDEWENAHQESFFFHLAGAVEALLHEINDAYALGLALCKVSFPSVRDALQFSKKHSVAFDTIDSLRNDSTTWLSLLFEWRNHGTHRAHVGKIVKISTNRVVDNEFTDPRSGQPQSVFPGIGCLGIVDRMLNEVEALILKCRTDDPLLRT